MRRRRRKGYGGEIKKALLVVLIILCLFAALFVLFQLFTGQINFSSNGRRDCYGVVTALAMQTSEGFESLAVHLSHSGALWQDERHVTEARLCLSAFVIETPLQNKPLLVITIGALAALLAATTS